MLPIAASAAQADLRRSRIKEMTKEAITSAVVALAGTVLFTMLLSKELLGPVSYVSLMGLLALVCIVLPVLSRLRELDIKNLRLTLNKIEQAKQDIFAKEEDLIRISLIASELIAFNSAFEGRLHDEESYRLQNEWYYHKIIELLDAVKAAPETRDEVLKYFHALRKIDSAIDGKRDFDWEGLMAMIRKDIGEG